jgi:hypothetical protein
MLMIVVNHEQSEHHQAEDQAAEDLARKKRAPDGSCRREKEQAERGNEVPPTPRGIILCEGSGGQYQFSAGSH